MKFDFDVEPFFNLNIAMTCFPEPDNPESQLCVSVFKDGFWKTEGCSEEKEFACKLKSSKNKNAVWKTMTMTNSIQTYLFMLILQKKKKMKLNIF